MTSETLERLFKKQNYDSRIRPNAHGEQKIFVFSIFPNNTINVLVIGNARIDNRFSLYSQINGHDTFINFNYLYF